MADQSDMTPLAVSWCNGISTRGEDLSTDAFMKNAFSESTKNGKALMKRPGTAYTDTTPGVAQGLFSGNGRNFYIVNDSIYPFTGGGSFPIPTPNPGFQPYTAFSPPQGNIALLQSVATGLWTVDVNSSIVTKVTDTNYNSYNVQPGLVFLDGVYYVIELSGRVLGSAIANPTVWPALDFVGADATLGTGVTVARHLNYLVAYYSNGVQVYYDANSAPNGQGIALGPASSGTFRTGCFSAFSVVEIDDVSVFMSQSTRYGRGVHAISGLTLQEITTPAVARILNDSAITPTSSSTYNNIWALGLKMNGHSFYVLCLAQKGISLVYDLTSQEWSVWTSLIQGTGLEQAFVGRSYLLNQNYFDTAHPPGMYTQDITTGNVMRFDQGLFTDATGPIPVESVTDNQDWGTLNWKRFGYGNQFADTLNTSISISYTDDDYQTFSTPRTIFLGSVRKQMRNCGSSRRRAWKMTHQDNTALRLFDFQWTATGLPR